MPGADASIPEDSSPEKYDLAGKPSTNTPEVMHLYDEFAPTYDDTLLSKWGYEIGRASCRERV